MYEKFAEALVQIVQQDEPFESKKSELINAMDRLGVLDSFQELLAWFDKDE